VSYLQRFDVIVVGGGHAGVEAATAAARLGSSTLLISQNLETLGQMSCNPAIGGIGKGHLVREVDAMGGIMARAADRAGIQFRILNARKGPAVRATRAQIDRTRYKSAIRRLLHEQANLYTFQQGVDDLIVENGRVTGIVTQMGLRFFAHAVVLTVGTFLGGRIHVGMDNYEGGRAGDPPANVLALRLRELPFEVGRLKTGTPPRLDRRSIDFSKLVPQPGDSPTPVFSFWSTGTEHPEQVECHITSTNERTHDLIRGGCGKSPMYTGAITGVGPRYCPSIEDKVVRFAERTSHQIFVEPEGLDSEEVYPNGISTSLPFDVQQEFVRSIRGFELARITRPGYAIEYDYFDPRGLHASLETKHIEALFFAGQINGTTGYEEAAAQGLIAGVNAACRAQDRMAWVPRRDQAYMGVLIDDLVVNGTQEPYRMFTSRAEYRLLLREDNADLRLTPKARELGLVDDSQWARFERKSEAIEREKQRLRATWLRPAKASNSDVAHGIVGLLSRESSLFDLLRRPGVRYEDLMLAANLNPETEDIQVIEQIEIQAKYAGYIERQKQDIERQRRHDSTVLPADFDYDRVSGLSNEVRQKLKAVRPDNLGQAARIPGMTPAALSLLIVYLKRKRALSAPEVQLNPIDPVNGQPAS